MDIKVLAASEVVVPANGTAILFLDSENSNALTIKYANGTTGTITVA